LTKAGVNIIGSTSSSDRSALYARQGPGLASAVFAADAILAAVLAAFGAILSLVVAARRRRHEYAAMTTAGVQRGALFAAMAIEQLVITGVAAIVGAIAGVVATLLIEPDIPEFINNPAGIKLDYHPSVTTVIATAGGSVVLLLAVVAIGVWILLRSIDPERLRAAAP
jgi:ABC-type lipoprotein release transport system permease subunit